MSLPRYPTYRESGIEWVGQVPEHWSCVRNKVVFREVDQRSDSAAGELLTVSHLTGVTPRSEKEVNMFLAESLEGYKCCERGDLVINTMWAWMGALGCSPCDGLVSPAYNVYRFRAAGQVLATYYDYLCRVPSHRTAMKANSTGVWESRLRLYPDAFLSMRMPIPPVNEQLAISIFLESETAKIDALVAEQRRLIDLLKEKRRAVISYAVTKGLDANARMKESGIEGLGHVPQHWDVMPLKWFAKLQRGHDLTDAEREEGPYPVVTSGGISGTHAQFKSKGPGVVTGRYGSTGRLFYLEQDFWPHNTALYVADFHGNDARFVWYSMQTIDFAAHSAKAAVPGIDRNDLHVLPTVVPPLSQQRVIAAYLDGRLREFEGLIEQAGCATSLLLERRAALVSAAVTGQIDVRPESMRTAA